jgi:hypothetical protein
MIAIKKQLSPRLHLAKRSQASQGFMLIEVLVASLLTFTFTIVSMQVLVMGTALRVKGQESSEAANWTRLDLEDIQRQSKDLNYCVEPAPGTTNSDSECAGISNNYKTSSATCAATASGNGYGALLATRIGGTQSLEKTSSKGSRLYTLKRETSIKASVPYNVLELTYKVYSGAPSTIVPADTPFYTFYSEVIPAASFACR